MNALQTHFWAVRDYLSPVLRESKFKEHGRITPEEFVAAGDFLAYKFPTWSWEKGDSSRTREFLPADKQYLMSRGVPCLRRVSQMESAALGSSSTSSSGEDGETLLSFADDDTTKAKDGEEDQWVATHIAQGTSASQAPAIVDIPDSEPPPGAVGLTDGQEDDLAAQVADFGLGGPTQSAQRTAGGPTSMSAGDGDMPDIGDIPDIDDEDDEAFGGMEGQVHEEEDPATLAPPQPQAKATGAQSSAVLGSGNLLQVRTYDCLITYDKYYQTPRMWLVGYDEHGTPLKPAQIFEDVSSDYAQKTVTIEPFPHSATLSTASIHPCKHASVMRKVIERMNAGLVEEQRRAKARAGSAAGKEEGEKKKKKGWGIGGAVRKVAGSGASKDMDRSASGCSTPVTTGGDVAGQAGEGEETEVEGLRVDQYMIIFLKFMASIVPAIEIDATQAV